MKKQDVKKKQGKERKSVKINLAVTPTNSKWMKKENISPQKIFDLALEELQKEK